MSVPPWRYNNISLRKHLTDHGKVVDMKSHLMLSLTSVKFKQRYQDITNEKEGERERNEKIW